jgi:hypothetical protein
MSKLRVSWMAALAAIFLLSIGFEMGARSVKFSPASEVEFSGALITGPSAKPRINM